MGAPSERGARPTKGANRGGFAYAGLHPTVFTAVSFTSVLLGVVFYLSLVFCLSLAYRVGLAVCNTYNGSWWALLLYSPHKSKTSMSVKTNV